MGPRDQRHTPQDDLFRSEPANLIDSRHPLVKLADRIHWSVFEREWSELFASPTADPQHPRGSSQGCCICSTPTTSLTRRLSSVG